MRNITFSLLLLPLLAGLSLPLSAAPSSSGIAEVTPIVTSSVAAPAMKININSADAPSLQQALDGIGKAKAEAIVAYREANGPFTSVDELLEIKGIGNALLERNRDKLILE
ncbi:ComEA family DNA-binding protein [Pseudomonas entomophila]|uniref:ComEA family DNA-binding protein n=1 Tax=Pseudomonas entomophila TaxID=312306 RepID=UPI00200BE64A|nr:helix-hairpin-helix domain-containing protein [Pseudomonas entomophila]